MWPVLLDAIPNVKQTSRNARVVTAGVPLSSLHCSSCRLHVCGALLVGIKRYDFPLVLFSFPQRLGDKLVKHSSVQFRIPRRCYRQRKRHRSFYRVTNSGRQ